MSKSALFNRLFRELHWTFATDCSREQNRDASSGKKPISVLPTPNLMG